MTALLFICFIYSIIYVYAQRLTWNESVQLPQGSGWIYAAVGWNKDYTKIYLISGLNSLTVPSPWIYQFDGITFKEITPIEGVYEYNMSTTVNEIIYYYSNLNNQSIYTYNTAKLKPGNIPQTNSGYGDLICMTSNATHLFLVYYNAKSDCDTLLIYNIKHEKWSHNTGNPPLTGGTFCAYYDHNLYIFGVGTVIISTNQIMMYNDISNQWNVSLLKQNYTACGSVAIMPQNDGIIYILGGYESCSPRATAVNSVDIFDANKMSISHSIGLTQKRGQPMVGLINGRVIVMGGNSKSIKNISPLQTTEISTNISSEHPTKGPTNSPTNSPTKSPTHHPTNSPSTSPTKPTVAPTYHPTKSPTAWKAEILITKWNIIYTVVGILGLIICCMICRCCKKTRFCSIYIVDDGYNQDYEYANSK